MFRKILDKAKSVNLQKLKKDAEIEYKKTVFNAKETQKYFTEKLSRSGLLKKIPSYKGMFKKLNLENLDKKYTQKVEKTSEKFSQKLTDSVEGLKKAGQGLKKSPFFLISTLSQFGKDSKWYVSTSFTEGREHIKEYLKANRKYFTYRKSQFKSFFTRSSRKIYIFGGAIVFLYALGSNIPSAIMNYKLLKDMEAKKDQIEQKASAEEVQKPSTT